MHIAHNYLLYDLCRASHHSPYHTVVPLTKCDPMLATILPRPATSPIIPCSAQAELGKIGKGPVHPSILTHSFMMAGWIFFILGTTIRYHGPVMHVK